MAKMNRSATLDEYERKMAQAKAVCVLLEEVGDQQHHALPDDTLFHVATTLTDLLEAADAAVGQYHRAAAPALRVVGGDK